MKVIAETRHWIWYLLFGYYFLL